MKRIAIAGVLLLAALAGWVGWHYLDAPRAIVAKVVEYFRGPTLPLGFASGNGRIEATEYDIATKRPTRIIAVLVKEGDLVEPGQIVARMDTADLEADLRTNQAQLAQAREDKRRALAAVVQRESDVRRADAAITQRESEIKRTTATIVQRESELVLAGQDVERAQPLLAPGAINRQEFEQYVSRRASAEAVLAQARAGREAAESALVEARAQKEDALAALESARVDVDFREAAIRAAIARIERVMTDIDDSTLKSPVLGRVQVKVAQPGEVLSAGGRVLNLIDLTDVYMTFFLPTATAGRVALGAEVRLVLDAAPDLVLPAQATFVADVAQFTPKTVETKVERPNII